MNTSFICLSSYIICLIVKVLKKEISILRVFNMEEGEMAALRVSRHLKPFSLVRGYVEIWALTVLRVTV